MAETQEKTRKERKKFSVRTYTDEERQAAVILLAANNGNVYRTAITLGIPVRTLQGWSDGSRHPELSQTSYEKKEALAARLDEIATLMVEGLDDPEKIAEAPLNVIATTLGIIVDKVRILRGEGPQGEAASGQVPKAVREILDPNANQDRLANVAARIGVRVPSNFGEGVVCPVSSSVSMFPVPVA